MVKVSNKALVRTAVPAEPNLSLPREERMEFMFLLSFVQLAATATPGDNAIRMPNKFIS
jgi:hypothetical protein